MKYLPLVLAGLWRRPMRTVFTFLSIVVAFILFGILSAIEAGFDTSLEVSRLDRLFVDTALRRLAAAGRCRSDRAGAGRHGGGAAARAGRLLPGPEKHLRHHHDRPPFLRRAPRTDRDQAADRHPANQPHRRPDHRVMSPSAMAGRSATRCRSNPHVPTSDGGQTWTFDIIGDDRRCRPVPARRATSSAITIISTSGGSRTKAGPTASWCASTIPASATQIGRAIDRLFANSPAPTRTGSEKSRRQAGPVAGRYQLPHPCRDRRGAVHAAVPDRQHHDAVGARAYARIRGAEDAGIFRQRRAGAGDRRSGAALPCRRPDGTGDHQDRRASIFPPRARHCRPVADDLAVFSARAGRGAADGAGGAL